MVSLAAKFIIASSIGTRTYWPTPRMRAACSALTMLSAAVIPLTLSASAILTAVGCPDFPPCTFAIPEYPWMTGSYAG